VEIRKPKEGYANPISLDPLVQYFVAVFFHIKKDTFHGAVKTAWCVWESAFVQRKSHHVDGNAAMRYNWNAYSKRTP
jgi:hypothetical protein